MTQLGGAIGSDARRAGAEYHGAEGDSRYPSSRRLRNTIANIADIVLVYGIFLGLFWAALVLDGDLSLAGDQTPVMLVSVVIVLLMVLGNSIVLPSTAGATLGQLLTGLAWIRGADGARPSGREMLRALYKHRVVFRMGGVQQAAPLIVVVRRRDIPRRPQGADGGYVEH